MESWNLLIEIVMLLAACLALGGICAKFKQSPLVGYLLAGMLMGGPGSFNVVHAEGDIEAIAELGVALLLFSLGLEFSWQRVKSLGGSTLLAGAIQVVVTGVIATGVAYCFQLGVVVSIAIGAMLSLSSTAAVIRVLVEKGDLDSFHGRTSLAILLVQDMAVVPLAILMEILTVGGTAGEIAYQVAKLLLMAAGFVAVLHLLLNYVAVKLLRALALEQNRELTILLAVVVGLGSTWAAHAVGISPALGAFVSGMFLGSSPFATQIRADVSSLRIVLLTLFFGAVGMVADPIWIAKNLGLVLGIAALIVASKVIVISLILKLMGKPIGVSLASGFCLAQVGEFAFVLGATALKGSVIDESLYMIVVSSAIVTLFVTPYLVAMAPWVAVKVERIVRRGGTTEPKQKEESFHRPEIVIIGFGPAGQAVGRTLAANKTPVTIIDLNANVQEKAIAMGLTGLVGDATQRDVLDHAHVDTARLVVITLPSRTASLSVLMQVRAMNPHAMLMVRSRYQLHQAEFLHNGADIVVGDEEQVGEGLSHELEQLMRAWSTAKREGEAENVVDPA